MSDFPSRIVCVDDNADIRELVRDSLELSGEDFVLVNCSSGEEIIQRIRELQPEFLILDLLLGDMTGPDVIDRLSEFLTDIKTPILLMTGKHDLKMLPEYEKLGVVGVLYKPFDPDDLVQLIRDAWASRADVAA